MKTIHAVLVGAGVYLFTALLFLLAAALLSPLCSGAQSYQVDPMLYADPIPRSITDPLFAAHGFTAAQSTVFAVIRICPLELGGTNAVENLKIISKRDAQWRKRSEQILIRRVVQGIMRPDDAIAALAVFEPLPDSVTE